MNISDMDKNEQLRAIIRELEADNERLKNENVHFRKFISQVANAPYDTCAWGYVVDMYLHNQIIAFLQELNKAKANDNEN